jgi:hypothetical protein
MADSAAPAEAAAGSDGSNHYHPQAAAADDDDGDDDDHAERADTAEPAAAAAFGPAPVTSPELEELRERLIRLRMRRDALDEQDPTYARRLRAMDKKELSLRKALREETKREKLRRGFKGTPSSYRHFSFSSTANARVRNHQDIEPYDPMKKNPLFRRKALQLKLQQTQQMRANTAPVGRSSGKYAKAAEEAAEEREARWRGVPYTNKKLSFSGTANRHIRNEQEYEQVTPHVPSLREDAKRGARKAHERWGLAPDREEDVPPPEFAGLVQHDTPWKGTPSSYEKLSFSSSANKHIQQKQAIPGSRITHTEPKKEEEEPEWRRRERQEKRWKLTGRGPPERVVRERGWQGSPSTQNLRLTFSSSANRTLHAKQELPQLQPLNPLASPKEPTKEEKARRKRIEKAKARLERNFSGSPTSYRHLTYSRPANRQILNYQDFSDYRDPLELGYGEPRAQTSPEMLRRRLGSSKGIDDDDGDNDDDDGGGSGGDDSDDNNDGSSGGGGGGGGGVEGEGGQVGEGRGTDEGDGQDGGNSGGGGSEEGGAVRKTKSASARSGGRPGAATALVLAPARSGVGSPTGGRTYPGQPPVKHDLAEVFRGESGGSWRA